jgi:8-oxo-dGTP diphosphatase
VNGTPETIRYTADVVAISGGREVLLIQRAKDPFKGSWALPGGHVDVGETSLEAAVRELAEETGVNVSSELLHLVGVYDAPGRDPRGRYVTAAYTAHFASAVLPTAGDDARLARWWPLADLTSLVNLGLLAFDHVCIINEALLQGA